MSSGGPVTVHLVRHGTHALPAGVLAGRMPGVGLDAAGRAQAARLAGLDWGPVAAVVTSPVQRCVETAGPIADRLGLAPLVEPGF